MVNNTSYSDRIRCVGISCETSSPGDTFIRYLYWTALQLRHCGIDGSSSSANPVCLCSSGVQTLPSTTNHYLPTYLTDVYAVYCNVIYGHITDYHILCAPQMWERTTRCRMMCRACGCS